MKSSHQGFTWVELLVCLAIIFILVGLARPAVTVTGGRSEQTGVLNKARQIQIATQSMTLDNFTAGKPLVWTCSNNVPVTLDQLTNALADGYLTQADLKKLFTATAEIPFRFDREVYPCFTVYAVTASDPEDTLFIATKNWQGMHSKELSGALFKKAGIVAMKKDGSGQIVPVKSINDAKIIGTGGKHNYLPLR